MSIVSRWNNSRVIEQLLVAPIDQSALDEMAGVVASGVGGVLLTGVPPANLAAQLRRLLTFAPRSSPPLVMADEEGGAVQRLAPLVANIPTARQMGATMTPARIEAVAKSAARQMKSLGLTMDLAPVADIDSMPGPNLRDADGTRSFSGIGAVATADSLAFAKGLLAGGIIPVVKHFPGLGGASGNTDLAVASTLPWATLEHSGLVPFARAVDENLPAIMVSNAVIPGLSRQPASLSRVVVTGELRDRLHFKGLVITDSLTAISISGAGYTLTDAVVKALEAGDDMVLFNASASTLEFEIRAIVAAVVRAVGARDLSRAQLDTAAARVLAVKHDAACTFPA